ncbi:AMP-binding protein [Niveispirillum sp.]|uniref:AMP-binding protein n=1 Tax=Niveispirillum sp. TaxID=1917217 RepID=UPI001B59452C|nr:AMP-binding protein [Niveispirillum sp.]MBP7337928.1 AMP-binding protein [Niveispirillum sp.]
MDYGPRSIEELRRLQLQRLRWTVEHTWRNVASFRAACASKGVEPTDIRSLSDVARLPFTTKSDLRAAYPFGLFAVPEAEVARIHASSGTTGAPTVVGYTKQDIDTWTALVARSIHAAGGRAGMRAHIAYGYGLFTGGLGAHYGAEALGCAVIPMSGGQTEKQVKLIQDFRPEIIMVTPSYMLAILDEFRRQGIDPRSSSLRVGIFGAEPWSEPMRREIETAFGLTAADIYGLSEVMGPGVAQEVPGTLGLTLWEDHFLPEIVDPQTGEPLPDGAEGELVLTSLSKQAFPIIRYRTRDLTRLLPADRLPYRRLARIVGRSDDMLIIRGVNVFPTQVEEQLLKCDAFTPHFVMEITRPQRMDEIMVQVEPRPGADTARAESQAAVLAGLIKENIGVTARISLCPPGSLARSQGKASHVRDLRQDR